MCPEKLYTKISVSVVFVLISDKDSSSAVFILTPHRDSSSVTVVFILTPDRDDVSLEMYIVSLDRDPRNSFNISDT